MTWRPSASTSTLQARATLLHSIRKFFFNLGVLEVETPILASSCGSDPYIEPLTCHTEPISYLHTSPEFAMKRLLAAGSGSIYQICKTFRAGEVGKHHHTEFSMLEWYRVGFNHHDLMNEMNDLLQTILSCSPAAKLSYRDMFLEYAQLDPFTISINALRKALVQFNINLNSHDNLTHDDYLNLILSHHIEPKLGLLAPVFIYDYPSSQSALARLQPGDPTTAARFEVYMNGIELANGFHELTDASEQRERFRSDARKREQIGKPTPATDHNFLAALDHGLPDCAGVALGIDRLLMILLELDDVRDAMMV